MTTVSVWAMCSRSRSKTRSNPSGSVLSRKEISIGSVDWPRASAMNCGPRAEPPIPTSKMCLNFSPFCGAIFPAWTSAANWLIRAFVSSMSRAEFRRRRQSRIAQPVMADHAVLVGIGDCARFEFAHGRKSLLHARLHFVEKSFVETHPADVDREVRIIVAQKIFLKARPERRGRHGADLKRKRLIIRSAILHQGRGPCPSGPCDQARPHPIIFTNTNLSYLSGLIPSSRCHSHA